ncbi:hypothetical protein VOI54_03885 [Tamlana sp. 2201CG12-4]|uniref:hypothetical protein n=1 Tax=Tamlana sp. 2201CG12-4 TaxID=3112582 RepID=UPI002DB813D5|nr:hypothetical protein [Tamlana sp. 2201CG12-4]MEC3906144.1 hypothetical protein [Tamlana sp. 2201CG12-4]
MMLDIRTLTLEQIRNFLDLDDNRSAIKWLNDNGIPISQIGRKYVVNQFMFELKQQQIAVEELKISYPSKWFEIYDANTPDKGMVKAISELYPRKQLIKVKKNKENSYIK